jgi:hypothetical protein
MKKTNQKIKAIKVYFSENEIDTKLMERIANISDGLGLSLSDTAGMILRAGVEQVEKKVHEMIGQKNEQKKSK